MESFRNVQTILSDQEIFILTLQRIPTLSPVIRLSESEADHGNEDGSLSHWQFKLHCLSNGETIILQQLDELPVIISQVIQSRQSQGRVSLR